VIEDAITYRTKEQVLYDLSKALQFSPDSLDANRKGQLSKEQLKQLYPRVLRPALLIIALTVGPFAVWTWMTAAQENLSLSGAFPVLLAQLTHMQDLFDAHGSKGAMLVLASFIVSLGLAAFLILRLPWALYFDLLDRKVETQEGRVTAREETTNRDNGRDPIEKYFFSLRFLNMPVNLAAYRALENGSLYIVYLTQRSQLLVSIEPKMEESSLEDSAGAPPKTSLNPNGRSTSPSKRAV
jgi:hypothetical protein